jgi:chaperonin GroEL
MECRLEDACVAVFGEPLDDLELLVRLLGRVAADGRPLLILTPSACDEAIAICVVNKLRGIIQCAVATARTPSQDSRPALAEAAYRIGSRIVTQSDARRLQGQAFLGRAATVRATSDGLSVTPAQR